MKLRERVVEARLRRGLISEQQSGFVARTTHAMFALRVLMEVYIGGQKQLHCCLVGSRERMC